MKAPGDAQYTTRDVAKCVTGCLSEQADLRQPPAATDRHRLPLSAALAATVCSPAQIR